MSNLSLLRQSLALVTSLGTRPKAVGKQWQSHTTMAATYNYAKLAVNLKYYSK